MDNQILWLLAGAALVVGEFFILPGVGLFFAGLGALLTGILAEAGIVEDTIYQWIAFFAASIGSALALWKPLKNFRQNKSGKIYQNMIGDKVVLETALDAEKEGKVKWSGTIMKAKLADSAEKHIPKGHTVEIVAVEGNVLVVK